MSEQPEQNVRWEEEVLTYVGRSLKGQSKVDSEKQWKVFRLEFDIGMDYPFKIDCFASLGEKEGYEGVKFNELEEGKDYLIKYKVVENAFQAHGKWHENRTVVFVGEPKEGSEPRKGVPNKTSQNTSSQGRVDKKLSESEFKDYFTQYMVNDGKKDVNHCLLSYFANVYEEEYSSLRGFIEEAFGNKEPEVEEEAIPMEDVE